MFATSSLVVLISAAAVMASTHGARTHNAIAAAKRENNTFSIGKRDQYNNKEFTWYPTDTGPDACTGQNHQDSDFYVAMGYNQYGDGSACCNRQLSITVNGKTATATCVDECASCPDVGQLDFTKGLFEYFSNGDLDVGVLYGSWSYADGSGSSGGDDGGDSDTTTTTKKTTTSTKHTTTSTTTHKTTTSTTHTPTTTSTSTTTTHTSEKPSSSKASSSAKPSSSSVHSSSVVESSSSSALPKSSSSSSPSAAPLPTAEATQGVANAGSSAGGSSADSDGDDTGISGAIGTGGSSSDAVSLSFNKLFATIAVVVLVAAQAF